MKNNKQPEIRFPEFTEDWEQRKLGEVAKRITRKNKGLQSTRPLTISARDGLVDQNDFFKKQVASRDVSGYFLVKNGEFAYNKSYSNGYPWGAIKRLDLYSKGVLSTLYIVFTPTKINSDFLVSYYDTTYWYKEISKHAAEGARNHGLLNIAASDFFETEIIFPKSEDEQKQIGTFFKQLDDTIALHQQELTVLKEIKQGFLQKMFPKGEEKVPGIRFPGFTDDWEQRKLGEVVQITMGQSPNGKNYTENPIDHILVQGNADMKNGRVVPRVWTTQITKTAKPNDIILSVRAPVGDIGKTDYDVVLGRGVAGIRGNNFVYQSLIKMKETGFWTRYSTGSTFESINSTDLKDAVISIPNEKEQQKIGAFFKQLDDTIALHQRELDLLKETKKAFLQKMFV